MAHAYWDKMTAEERSAEVKRRRAKGKRKKRSHPKNKRTKEAVSHGKESDKAQIGIAYACGHCEAWLQSFCERFELPVKDVTRSVGGFLQR